MAIVLQPRTETMPGFALDMDDAHTPASDYTFQGPFSSGSGMMCFPQTAPADLNSSWVDATAEGQQNFLDYSDHGDVHVDHEDYSLAYSHMNTRKDHSEILEDFHGKWTIASEAVASPEPMRRIASRSSSGSQSHKRRTARASSTKSRPSRRSSMSPGATPITSYDVSNTLAYHENARLAAGVPYLMAEPDTTLSVSPLYAAGIMGMTPDGLPYTTDMSSGMVQHVDPTCTQVNMDFEPSLASNSPPQSWSSSSRSSPELLDDTFSPPLVASPTETHETSSSQGHSPRYVTESSPLLLPASHTEDLFRAHRKFGPQMIPEDLSRMGAIGDDFALSPPFNSRRQSSEGESARDHPLYKHVQTGADGLFHCPWEGQPSCNHKAEKLKCNYDKFVDSHLKPYRCKHESCENSRFSSTACLLRHEREAHAMHGHGDKPYLCTYKGCDRAQPGNGFPRQWNLKDHMRRVHHDDGASLQATSAASPPPSGSAGHSKASRKKTATRKSSLKSGSSMDSSNSKVEANQAYEEWHKHRQSLTSMVSNFAEPDDPSLLQYLSDAQSHLTAMGQASTRYMTLQKTDLSGPYMRSYPQQSG